jgi:hypothetical protein
VCSSLSLQRGTHASILEGRVLLVLLLLRIRATCSRSSSSSFSSNQSRAILVDSTWLRLFIFCSKGMGKDE